MITNFKEMLPQERGALVANAQANQFPDGSKEQQQLLGIRNDGFDAVDDIRAPLETNRLPPQGRPNSRRRKLTPSQLANKVVQQMLAAGKTPQEIGAAVAEILGCRS